MTAKARPRKRARVAWLLVASLASVIPACAAAPRARDEGRPHLVDSAALAPKLRARFPGLPVGPPDGAVDERMTYVHLPLLYLEHEALRRLLGEARADRAERYWEPDHYRALYRCVRENEAVIAEVVARRGLASAAPASQSVVHDPRP